MKRHWSYLKYVMRHKWFVLLACRRIGASLWLGVIHDISKFHPSEWFPYAETFYKVDGSKQFSKSAKFDTAWGLHQKRNKHHWEHWLLSDGKAQEMPKRYALEMVADWMGAGRAIKGAWEYKGWYADNKSKITLHANTRALVENIMQI